MATEQGHYLAAYNLGVAYADGEGVPQDHEQAVAWWWKAADLGSARAQYNLGVAYSRGIMGVPQDEERAVKFWLRAAVGNSETSEAPEYASRPALSQQTVANPKWILGGSSRGELGFPDAQYHLARMYASGRGVSRDNTKAMLWLRKSAAQGHQDAMRELTGKTRRKIAFMIFAALSVGTVIYVFAR